MSKSFLRFAAILAFLPAVLCAAVMVPAYEIIGADYLLSTTLLFDAIDLLWQWCEIALLAVIITLLLVGVYRVGARDARPLYFICGGALLLKYLLSIVSTAVVFGSFDLTVNYGTTVFSFVLELLLCALTVLLAHRAIDREKGSPFLRLFARGSTLQNAAYISIGAVTLLRLVSFVASEIAYSMLGFAFAWSDLPVTLLYALLNALLPGFLAYISLFYIVCHINRQYFAAEKTM